MANEAKGARRPRGDGFSEERKRLFLVALKNGESVLAACALVGVSNRTAYNHRDRDPAFARDWRLARQMSSMPLDLAAFQRAVSGVEEPVYAYGKLSHRRVRRSDALLARLLVADQPEKYGRHAGFRAERERLDRRIEKRVAAATAPLREALAAVEAELAALRTLRNNAPSAVNFMNPVHAPDPAAAASPRRGKGRAGWRLAAARRRLEAEKDSEFPCRA